MFLRHARDLIWARELTRLALTIEPVSHRINQVCLYHGSLTEGRILVSEMKTVIKVHHLIQVLR